MQSEIDRLTEVFENWMDGLRDDPRDHPEYQEQQIDLFEVNND